ncbi:MAG TPA: FecR domain-containing protein [Puia sp.]|uniref:FecR family protein n=1 Tax=Puia sp. TaxID=2045100 RepID=UPI002B84E8D3|nr:FecR domain-containing protein [Puia sp.]HVU95652.1 FecR domain-containing protein [Puia sp.]
METPQRLAYLFRRYMEKNCTPREKDELFALILQAEHDDTLRRLIAETWNEAHPSYPQDKSRADTILREIISKNAAEPPPETPTNRHSLPTVRFTSLHTILFNRWAACFLLFIGIFTLTRFLLHRPHHPAALLSPPPAVTAQVQPADRCLTLPDGSKILLHKTAKLDFQSGFTASRREVTLHGEAYFDIHKDTRPFIVHTGAIRTTVLGTAFDIDANNEHDIVITVTKGKVKVENDKGEFSILHRNERLSVDSSRLQKMAVNAGETLVWKKSWLLFNDVTMQEAMDTLARRYHLVVAYSNPAAQSCPVTATFSGGETLGEMINVLTKINNMNFSIDRDHVLITGDGCK